MTNGQSINMNVWQGIYVRFLDIIRFLNTQWTKFSSELSLKERFILFLVFLVSISVVGGIFEYSIWGFGGIWGLISK